MKTQSYSIRVQKSCSENWSAMIPNETGKFCLNCEKNVIDFSNMSDDQLISMMEKTDGKICGRLRKDQVERILVASKTRKVSPRLNAILAGLFTLGLLESPSVKAAPLKNSISIQNTLFGNAVSLSGEKTEIEIVRDSSKNIISGKIIIEGSTTPIANATIYIGDKNSPTTFPTNNFSATTDSLGQFSFPVPDNLMSDTITLQITAPGYEWTKKQILRSNVNQPVTISMQYEMIMGGMIYEPETPKKEKKKKS